MANDNKKINDLVSENDDDTSELEVLTATVIFDRDRSDEDYESESDAATHSFQSPARSTAGDDPSIAALKSDLQQREENISNLQYDIAELRARWTGLEKELRAREELTDNVTTELEQSNRKLAQTISLLKKRDQKISSLEASLERQSAQLAEAETAIEQARGDSETQRTELDQISERYQAAQKAIETLNSELTSERAARRWAEDAEQAQGVRLERLEAEHGESRSLVATLQQYIEGRKSSWERQESELKSRAISLKEQRKENARLAREARVAADRLRKEASARQKLQSERDSLQTGLQQARSEGAVFAESLAAAERCAQALQEDVAALQEQVREAAPLLEQEKAQRRKLESQLADERRKAELLQAELSALQQSYSAKDGLLSEQQDNIQELALDLETTRSDLAAERTRRIELEQELALLQGQADRLRREQNELSAETARKDELLDERSQEVATLTSKLDLMTASFDTEQSGRQELLLQYEELQQETTSLRSEIGALRVAAAKLPDLEKANAELSGLVRCSEDVVRDLKNQVDRTEGYADVLRMKLQQQQAQAEALAAQQETAARALSEALERADDLAVRLESEQQISARLKAENEEAARHLEEEVRRIRFEYDTAQATLAESQTLNQQLTADLVESSGKRRTLEGRLAEADEARDRDIRDLSKQVAQFRQQIDDYERKISNKDAAINALLTELAHKPETAEDNAAADDVVHRLADRKSPPSSDDRTAVHHEKDRVTRLLMGNIDGQELRFPLFKDKLTIGRTVHNDIQLKAQYVSRRHAVVVTEGDHTRIVDWGSKNGIYVNGKRVSEHKLRNGDRVSVGTAEFRYEERPKR